MLIVAVHKTETPFPSHNPLITDYNDKYVKCEELEAECQRLKEELKHFTTQSVLRRVQLIGAEHKGKKFVADIEDGKAAFAQKQLECDIYFNFMAQLLRECLNTPMVVMSTILRQPRGSTHERQQ